MANAHPSMRASRTRNPSSMAIVRLGSLASGISGAVGGLVFVSGKNGTVVRPRPAPSRPTSDILDSARARVYNIRRHWSSLSSLQQDAWRTAAVDTLITNALGLTSSISGFALFVRVNARDRSFSSDIREEPTTVAGAEPSADLGASFSVAGDYDITGVAQLFPPSQSFFLYGWPFARDTPSRDVARLRFLKSVFNPGPSTDVKSEWIALFGALQVGQQFAVGSAARLGTGYLATTLTARSAAAA